MTLSLRNSTHFTKSASQFFSPNAFGQIQSNNFEKFNFKKLSSPKPGKNGYVRTPKTKNDDELSRLFVPVLDYLQLPLEFFLVTKLTSILNCTKENEYFYSISMEFELEFMSALLSLFTFTTTFTLKQEFSIK